MFEKPHFIIATLSDRYDLSWERQVIAEAEDFDAELRAVPTENFEPPIDEIRDADALLITSRNNVSRELIEQMPNLKVISKYAVGLDHIDLDAATDHGVVVTHFPDYCTNEVADHAMALILACNRRVVELDRDLREGAWTQGEHHTDAILRGPVPALRELTLGIIGYGRIGRAVARRAAPFGLKIIAADPYVDPSTVGDIELVPLDELLGRADLVTIHAPLTQETRGLLGEAELNLLKPTAFVINTARGPIIDMQAATDWAKANPQGGLALDVVDPEPLPKESPLYGLPNVILTPHSAYYSLKSVEILREESLLAALEVLRGRQPRVVANPAVLDRLDLEPAAMPVIA